MVYLIVFVAIKIKASLAPKNVHQNLSFVKDTKGPFIYYVITFLGFWTPLPPYVSMFLVLRISKNWHFLTPLPPYKC